MIFFANVSLAALCFCVCVWLYPRKFLGMTPSPPSPGYVLENRVTHARLLPKPSSHAFTYPTISLLVSLRALESHALDLWKGFLFGFGGLYWRITGLRAQPYLMPSRSESILGKLRKALESHGLYGDCIHDAWMMTMPNFLGWEGINPLTVYYCYSSFGELCCVVLEIHNTFGESHIHVLELGVNEDIKPSPGFDHQWTFPRQFHVSPFNDRSGFYRVSLKPPHHPPPTCESSIVHLTPQQLCPTIRVNLYTDSFPYPENAPDSGIGPLKLTATLRPIQSNPMTPTSLLAALARAPFALLLSFSRIAYEAWILHYIKRLDVFIRPEPFPVPHPSAATTALTCPLPESAVAPTLSQYTSHDTHIRGGGIKWLSFSLSENKARTLVLNFLAYRAHELLMNIIITSADPSIATIVLTPKDPRTHKLKRGTLEIRHLSGKFYTMIVCMPSVQHALALNVAGSPRQPNMREFWCSSEDLFQLVFSDATGISSPYEDINSIDHRRHSGQQRLRSLLVPLSLSLPIPPMHFLDTHASMTGNLTIAAIILKIFLLDTLEKRIFALAKARVVPGFEPWTVWERPNVIVVNEQRDKYLLPAKVAKVVSTLGSFRREPEEVDSRAAPDDSDVHNDVEK